MAFVSLLLSFLAKKIGSIVQAVFGWSVTALFGRLPGNKQIAVSIALLLSIAWPIFVVGLFFPAVAGWTLAFLPLDRWVGPVAMRIAWGALALTAPLLVGALVHWAAPSPKGGLARTLLNGYPLALGFFVAFVVTVVTVPLVKLMTIVRRQNDTHVYVQARNGRYDAAVHDLAEACARAGLTPEITDVPVAMALATKALNKLAAGAVSPIVYQDIRRVRAEGVELYLYASDLLVRGDEQVVARARAMLARTSLDQNAYLVASERGQSLQDELMRLIDVVAAHERRHERVGAAASQRLVEIWREINAAKLPFEEWTMLETIARRVERRLTTEHYGDAALVLDREADALDEKEQEKLMASEQVPSSRNPEVVVVDDELSTRALVIDALDEAKELVRIEVELAKAEAKQELEQVKRAAIGFGIALGATVLVLCLLAMALVLALGGTPLAALGVAGGLLLVGGVAAFLGYGFLPKQPFEKTRSRLQTDVNQLKEHIA